MLSGEMIVSRSRFGSGERSFGGVDLPVYDQINNMNSFRVKFVCQGCPWSGSDTDDYAVSID
jgi:hypothetical protein